jgi:hypothetical protein
MHAGREAVGTCGRCGNYFCEVCRTRWRNQVLCTACVERALESREAAPEQARAHLRQAGLGLLLGGAAWVFMVLAQLLIVAGGNQVALALLGVLLILGSAVLAMLGLGQAAAALRARGNHMILATIGLIVSGLYAGVFIGIFAIRLWYI